MGRLVQGEGIAMDAIEANAEWAEHARPHYRRVFASTVEAADLPLREYDAVVCADVLEHVVDPVAVLRRLKAAAKEDATFIISLPNVAHVAIRLMLLGGQFPQMDRGILDRTHLHFYTRDTAEDMLHQAGLRIEKVSTTGVPLEEVWRRGEGKGLFHAAVRMQHALVDMAPRLFAFQWIFLARS